MCISKKSKVWEVYISCVEREMDMANHIRGFGGEEHHNNLNVFLYNRKKAMLKFGCGRV
jgi:hypothetical protein